MTILSTASYEYLAGEVLALDASIEKGCVLRKYFPDGESYHQLLCAVTDKDFLLVGGTISDADTVELLDIAMGLIEGGAKSIKMVIPYFGYATMERKVKLGEIVKAKNRAQMIGALANGNTKIEVLLFDLHSEGIPYYFSSDIYTNHIYCKSLIMDAARKYGGENLVLAATDAGRAKWVESLAIEMNVDAAFIYKRRTSGSETEIVGINADVKDRVVVIYDDMIRTGGSLMQAAKAYKENGASKIIVLTTHGLFADNALEKIKSQGIIAQVWCTNSHVNATKLNDSFLHVASIASLIVGSI